MNNLMERAVAYATSGAGLDDHIQTIEGLQLPSASEDDTRRCDQIKQILKRLQDYVDAGTVKRPLSIVVFGPPGSGKSTFVDRITKALKRCRPIPTARPGRKTNSSVLLPLLYGTG